MVNKVQTCDFIAETVKMETYLERRVKDYMSLLQDIEYYSMSITKENNFRVALYYDDIIKGRDIIQPKVKEIMKEVFDLDEIVLERCYEATSKNEQTLFEMIYKVPEDVYNKIYILSKISK